MGTLDVVPGTICGTQVSAAAGLPTEPIGIGRSSSVQQTGQLGNI